MNPLRLSLLLGALLYIIALIGGTRLVFALPAYGLLAVAGLTCILGRKGTFTRPDVYCLGTAGLLCAWVLARASFSPIPYLAWPDGHMVVACLIVYALLAWFLTGTTERTILFCVLLALGIGEVILGIRQFTAGDELMLFGIVRPVFGHRPSGTFIHSIHYAGYLEAMAPIALSLACWSRWRIEGRLAVGFTALLCYLGVAISGSRGGYVSTVFSILVFWGLSLWLLFRVDRGKFLIALIVGVAILVSAGAGIVPLMERSPVLRHRISLLTEQFDKNGKLDIRLQNWQAALDQFRTSPWIGTGSGTHLYYGRYFRRPQVQADPVHAHSDYLELLAEYGLAGGAAMLLFLGVHIGNSLRASSRAVEFDVLPLGETGDNRLALQVGMLSAVAAYLVHSAFDFNMHIPGNALIFAAIFGVMANPRPAPPAGPAGRLEGMLPRLSLPILGLWMLAIGLPKFPGEYWTEEARKALRDRKFLVARELSEKATKLTLSNPELFFYQGEAERGLANALHFQALRRPRFSAALVSYDKALQLFPQDENVWIRRAQALDGLQKFAEAEASYRQALALDPQLGILHKYLGAHLSQRGQAEEAKRELDTAFFLSSGNLSPVLASPLSAGDLQLPGSD